MAVSAAVSAHCPAGAEADAKTEDEKAGSAAVAEVGADTERARCIDADVSIMGWAESRGEINGETEREPSPSLTLPDSEGDDDDEEVEERDRSNSENAASAPVPPVLDPVPVVGSRSRDLGNDEIPAKIGPLFPLGRAKANDWSETPNTRALSDCDS